MKKIIKIQNIRRMARMIRDWTDSDKMASLSAEAERFFTRLIMKVDDFGCFFADLRLLRAWMFPLQTEEATEEKITGWMNECVKAKLIVLYQHDKKDYLQILNFGQRLRVKKAKFPIHTQVGEPISETGYVYVIGTDISDGNVKIGYSLNPWARAKELSTGNHKPLLVLITFQGTKKNETELHKALKPYNRSNYETEKRKSEWFSLPNYEMDVIKEYGSNGNTINQLIEFFRSDSYLTTKNSSTPELEEELEPEVEEKRELQQEGGLAPNLSESNLFRKPKPPTKNQVWEVFSRAGGTKEMAKSFFEKHESTSWFLNGSPITNFASLANKFIDTWKRNDEQKGKKQDGPAIGTHMEKL